MPKRECEYVDYIDFLSIKKGEYIEIDGKYYVVAITGQNYRLIPIDLSKVSSVNKYDIKKPIITKVFDAKNGNCLRWVKKEDKDEY